MSNQKKYWRSLEELNRDPEYMALTENEFPEELPVEEIFHDTIVNAPAGRRDFLKMMGFGITAATIAAG